MNLALGMGDVLRAKMIFDENKIEEDIVLDTSIIHTYRNGSAAYFKFVFTLLCHLFGPDRIKVVDRSPRKNSSYIGYAFPTECSLRPYFDTTPLSPLECTPYIVIWTKCRLDRAMSTFLEEKEALFEFIKTYLSEHAIVLLGEREIGPNLETKIHNVQCYYAFFKDCLVKNNEVIDMTQQSLTNGGDFALFQRDVRVLANATCVYGLGYGGNFVMSTAFAPRYHFYIGTATDAQIVHLRSQRNPAFGLHTTLSTFMMSF